MPSLKQNLKDRRPHQPLTSTPPARTVALACLTAVFGEGRDVQEVLDHAFEKNRLEPRDRNLATELCYGYLRLKARIDFVLGRFLTAPEKLPAELLRTLGVACYELFYLDRVPAYATVDWAVSQTRASYGQALGKLANAVLRKVDQEKDAACDLNYYRNKGDADVTVLARYYSCPEWIVSLWLTSYGPEKTQCYLKAAAAPPLLGLRVNLQRPEGAALLERLAAHPECRARLDAGLAFPQGRLDGVEEEVAAGRLSRQSLAAQQALLQLDPDGWRPPVWDACAGRGGKACLLLERGVRPLWASDTYLSRLKGLRSELDRLGLASALVFLAAGDQPLPLKAKPRSVLLDVPCSGLGVLSRRPDAKWRRHPRDLRTLAAAQTRLLRQAFHALAPGGMLAYITCTLNPDENERCVERFLADAGPAARLEEVWSTWTQAHYGEFFWTAKIIKR